MPPPTGPAERRRLDDLPEDLADALVHELLQPATAELHQPVLEYWAWRVVTGQLEGDLAEMSNQPSAISRQGPSLLSADSCLLKAGAARSLRAKLAAPTEAAEEEASYGC